MRKIINSATTQYEPVLTEELVLDDRPISGSFNGITSDAVYKAISIDPGNVPPVESTDNGKVLTASYSEGEGSFEWATPEAPQSELPDYSSTEVGKVLGVVADYDNMTNGQPATILDWVNQPAPELPAQLGTSGQVLTVNAGATGVEWATPSGGGGGSSITWYSTTNPTITSSDFGTNDVLSVTPSGLSFGNTKPGVLYISLGIFNEFQTLPTTIPTPVNVTVKVSGYDAMEEEYTIGQLNAIRFYGGHRYWVSGSVVMPAGLLSGSTTTGNILKVSLTPPDDISGKSWPTTWDDLYMSVGVVN